MISQSIKIQSADLEKLKHLFESLEISRNCQIVYEKQIPNFALILVEGKINIIKKKKVHEIITSPIILGLCQLLHHTPVNYGCEITRKSTILMIPKSLMLMGNVSDSIRILDSITRASGITLI